MSSLDAYLKRTTKAAGRTSSSQSSDAAQTDVEDLKTDIPYFDDPQQPEPDAQRQQQHFESAWSPAEETGTPEPQQEELQLDDSYADSDYGASGSAANSYYQSPTPSNSDIMLRPPSNSSFHYSYSSPGPGSAPNNGSNGTSASTSGSVGGSVGGSGNGRLHAAYAHSQTLALPPPSSTNLYPNMWYPNAPYGSTVPGHVYGRYAGYAVPPNAASYVAAAAAAAAHGMLPHGQHQHAPLHHPHPHPHAHPHPHHQHTHHPHPHDSMMEMFQLSNR